GAMAFHSGLVGISFGYVFAFLFYDEKRKKFKFNLRSITVFLIIITIFIFSYLTFGELIFVKFQNIENIDDIVQVANPIGIGGSAYLDNLIINNIFDFILYSPIKAFYFIFSPVIIEWRGLNDLLSFLTDTILYL